MEYAMLIIGLLLIAGSFFTFKHTKNYLALKTSDGNYSGNQFSGFALWGGYGAAGILAIVGVILLIVSLTTIF